jgi:hypothetical protein
MTTQTSWRNITAQGHYILFVQTDISSHSGWRQLHEILLYCAAKRLLQKRERKTRQKLTLTAVVYIWGTMEVGANAMSCETRHDSEPGFVCY